MYIMFNAGLTIEIIFKYCMYTVWCYRFCKAKPVKFRVFKSVIHNNVNDRSSETFI